MWDKGRGHVEAGQAGYARADEEGEDERVQGGAEAEGEGTERGGGAEGDLARGRAIARPSERLLAW